jgi:hypothetical protein
MVSTKRNGKQNVTISLDRKTIQKAKIFAARRSTSISGLLAHLAASWLIKLRYSLARKKPTNGPSGRQ